ncbi:EF-P 5-aminopentanol modification-associated protein YfmF [Alkaliphilus peptidifermentans]|uniref:Predicted Zn-dependent peptidase n=1 Tax=Alkaliphilus peptidifermentans DSM 18978 TaxID=1120976 RepID=A0A1G5BG52_9FIRM|nr:pitrilysin family protein [Alkaliphilus peptidifermentans]SCX89129.1 Predicted Zn-dependent peptidase [Alkaliphilus peptidifermentans DSM 18978]
MLNLTSEQIADGLQLHTVNEDKFKTNLINIYFKRPLIPEEVTYNALLPMVLQRGTKHHKTSQELAKKLDYLYGSSLNGDVGKKGERQIILFSLNTVGLKYIDDKNLLEDCMKLMNEILFDTLIEGEGFKEEYVAQEKLNLESRIKGRLNDKNRYAYDRCIEEMCRNEKFHLYEYGILEDIPQINGKNLLNHYRNIIETSPIDIVVVGSLQHQQVKEYITNSLKFNQKEIIKIEDDSFISHERPIHEVDEKMEINQGKLSLGYRTNLSYQDPLYPALMVYSSILGGGPHSKLFLKVREERSLCYYIYSKLEKFKSLMMISSGIEVDKANETKTVVQQQIDEMKDGKITDHEMTNGKKALITAIEALGDSAGAMAEYTYSQIVGNHFINPDELIEKINSVRIEDVVMVAKKVQLDTVYFLKGLAEEGGNI